MSGDSGSQPFGTRALAILIGAGIVLLAGFLLASGFGPALGSGGQVASGPASNAAHGFRGIVTLVENLGSTGDPEMEWDHPGLLVVTPHPDTDPDALKVALADRFAGPTLLVLPKYIGVADPERRGWVRALQPVAIQKVATLVPEQRPAVQQGVVANVATAQASGWMAGIGPRFALRGLVQTARADADRTLLSLGDNRALLYRTDGSFETPADVYVLADPSLIDNLALARPRAAQAALALLDTLTPTDNRAILFSDDFTTATAGRNLLRLMLSPPFLAVTLAVLAAALLAGWAALVRFGPVARENRALAFGKRALVDSITSLTQAAGRVTEAGDRYADLMRERLRQRLHAPPELAGDALRDWLDARTPPGAPLWSELDHRLRVARTEQDLLRAARTLDDWQGNQR